VNRTRDLLITNNKFNLTISLNQYLAMIAKAKISLKKTLKHLIQQHLATVIFRLPLKNHLFLIPFNRGDIPSTINSRFCRDTQKS